MNLDGGCLCGAVRYRLCGALIDAGFCHCSLCRSKLDWLHVNDALPQFPDAGPDTA